MRATVDDSMGILLPIEGLLLAPFGIHSRVWILDHRKRDAEAHFGLPGVKGCTLIHQFGPRKTKFQKIWTTNRHCMCIQVGFDGYSGRLKGHIASHPRNYIGFQRKMSTQGWIWEPMGEARSQSPRRPYLRFPSGVVRFLRF